MKKIAKKSLAMAMWTSDGDAMAIFLCSDASHSDGDVRKKQRCDAMVMRLEALHEGDE